MARGKGTKGSCCIFWREVMQVNEYESHIIFTTRDIRFVVQINVVVSMNRKRRRIDCKKIIVRLAQKSSFKVSCA